MKFLIRAAYDTLPSPANLQIWYKTQSPNCDLCGCRCTLKHILSSCTSALADGRYRWRHDEILKEIAKIVENAIRINIYNPDSRQIRFIKAGANKPQKTRANPNLLSAATDWELRADVGERLRFPEHITTTKLRPDIVFFSEKLKKIVLWELTVPWEENAEEAHERKRLKYDELLESCRAKGWRASCSPIEVGARGFLARSLSKAFTDIGLVGERKRKALKSISEIADRTANWLWIKRSSAWTSQKNGWI